MGHLHFTNSDIWTSPTLSYEHHQPRHQNFTNSTIWFFTNSGYVPRTLLSKLHELYHLNITAQEGIWWVYGRGETSKYCELYYQNITNSKTSRTRCLNSNFYYLDVTNASNPVGVGLCVCVIVYVCVCVSWCAHSRSCCLWRAYTHICTEAHNHRWTLELSFSHTHTQIHTHAHANTHTRTHAHTQIVESALLQRESMYAQMAGDGTRVRGVAAAVALLDGIIPV